uniref:MBL fold metallo-hydrolase n=1 Tax=uncultured Rhizobium sp. TaxID=155567 RepID=UPI00262038AE|nr:MBL fold metallo-hydrolase [uncultured Rhizobium sp.]
MADPGFDRTFAPCYGTPVPVAAQVQRITVNNPSPFTFHGTNSYIVGDRSVCVIDPGPDDEAHFQALMEALRGREVTHIAVSHTHRDHSPLAARLKAATGALTVAEGPHRPSRPLHDGEVNPFAESADMEFSPDIRLGHGARVEGDGWALTALSTPGHCANHTAFALDDSGDEHGVVFSADHVMAWATSIVAPPDGAMADYMASLEMLLGREDRIYFPGHGGPVTDPLAFCRGLRTHRRMRERAILERIRAGDRTIPVMVEAIYRDTDRRLHGAAALSVLAHLEDLVARGDVTTEGAARLAGVYLPG